MSNSKTTCNLKRPFGNDKFINASRFQFICLLCCKILVVRPKFSIRPNQAKARTHWIRMRSSLPRDTVSTELHQCREITRASRDQPLINNSLHHTHSDIATLTAPASLGTAEQWHPDKPNKNKAERKLWTRQSTLNNKYWTKMLQDVRCSHSDAK